MPNSAKRCCARTNFAAAPSVNGAIHATLGFGPTAFSRSTTAGTVVDGKSLVRMTFIARFAWRSSQAGGDLVSRLVQHHGDTAGQLQHDRYAPALVYRIADHLNAFATELTRCHIDVV